MNQDKSIRKETIVRTYLFELLHISNSSSFEYIIVNYFIISLAILKDQPDFVHVSHVVDTHMSGLSVTEGRRPELIASNGAFHINKTHPYIHVIS